MVSIQRGVGAVPKTLQKYGKLCCVRVFIMQNFKKRKGELFSIVRLLRKKDLSPRGKKKS